MYSPGNRIICHHIKINDAPKDWTFRRKKQSSTLKLKVKWPLERGNWCIKCLFLIFKVIIYYLWAFFLKKNTSVYLVKHFWIDFFISDLLLKCSVRWNQSLYYVLINSLYFVFVVHLFKKQKMDILLFQL